ncbi:MAG: hypothetical protein AB7O28_05060 [Vicinamibacterales bacterium]
MQKECPQCGETMRLNVREEVRYIPGTPEISRRSIREWICPDCDYFEEVEPDEDLGD